MTRSRTIVRRSLITIVIMLVLAQLIRPARTNAPINPAERVDAHLTIPSGAGHSRPIVP
jgi:hypothetical protein